MSQRWIELYLETYGQKKKSMLFSDCKTNGRVLQEQSKAVLRKMLQSWTLNTLEHGINFRRRRRDKWCLNGGPNVDHLKVLQLNRIVSTCLQEPVLPWNTAHLYKRLLLSLSLCCMQTMCLVTNFLHLYSSPFHVWGYRIICTRSHCVSLPGCFPYCHLSMRVIARGAWRENKKSLQERKPTSSLVFYFYILYKP